MSRSPALWCRVIAGATLLGVACSYPTDNSAGAFVTVSAPQVLIRGSDTVITAHVYMVEHGHDTVEVENVVVTWLTSDANLASLTPISARQARLTGVNPGIDTITAIAPALQSAQSARRPIHIASALEVDGVSPHSLMYGEQLTLSGVGAATADVLLLNGTQLTLNSWSGSFDTLTGLGKINFWVGYPARGILRPGDSDTLVAIGNGIVDAFIDSVNVNFTRDLFDSFPAAPSHIDIDQRPFKPTAANTGDERDIIAFYNPALYAEEPLGLPFKFDWYHFNTANPDSAWTFIYSAPGLLGREATFLTGPTSAGAPLSGSWTYGSGHYNCKGWQFTAAEVPSPFFVASFTRLPPGGVELMSLFIDRGAYLLAVIHGYATFSNVHPDRFEGDNTCDLADSNFTKPALHIDLAAPFSDTLNVDNAFDIDWLRFHVPGAAPQTVTVRLKSQSYSSAIANPSDVVLYVTNVPTSTTPLSVLKSALTGGNSKSLSVTLAPGDYYLVAHDSVGVPAVYALCMAVGATCTLPTLPDVAASSAAAAPNPAFDLRKLLAPARKRRTPR